MRDPSNDRPLPLRYHICPATSAVFPMLLYLHRETAFGPALGVISQKRTTVYYKTRNTFSGTMCIPAGQYAGRRKKPRKN